MKTQLKEMLGFMFHFDLKNLFLSPTKNSIIQLFRSVFVGGISTVIDFIVYALMRIPLQDLQFCDLIATPCGFIVGTVFNFIVSRLLIFNANESRVGIKAEFAGFAVIGVIGLGIKELLMFLFVNLLSIHHYLSWIVSSFLVLVWNFAGRKLALYK